MSKPRFTRDETGHLKVHRNPPAKKFSTGRPVGFNASRDGFQTAPKIVPAPPIPSSDVYSFNRKFEVDPNLPSEELEKRRKQFEVIQNLNKQRHADSLVAYVAYKNAAREYSNAITSGEGEPLNPEAAKLAPAVTETYNTLVRFKLQDEHVDTMMKRLAYEHYVKDYEDRNEAYKVARAECLAELEFFTKKLNNSTDANDATDSDAQRRYNALREARESCRKKLFTLQYDNANKNLDFAINKFELYTDDVASGLSDDEEIYVDDAELVETRTEFYRINREYELATFELLSYRGSETEKMKEIEEEANRHNERILTVLEYNYDRLDSLLEAKSTHSEEAESEATYQVSLHRDLAKKELVEYRNQAKGIYTEKERAKHKGHSIDDSYRSDCRLCGGKG